MVIFLCAQGFFFSCGIFIRQAAEYQDALERIDAADTLQLFIEGFVNGDPQLRAEVTPGQKMEFGSVGDDAVQVEQYCFQHFFLSFGAAHADTVFFSATLISSFSCSSSS